MGKGRVRCRGVDALYDPVVRVQVVERCRTRQCRGRWSTGRHEEGRSASPRLPPGVTNGLSAALEAHALVRHLAAGDFARVGRGHAPDERVTEEPERGVGAVGGERQRGRAVAA